MGSDFHQFYNTPLLKTVYQILDRSSSISEADDGHDGAATCCLHTDVTQCPSPVTPVALVISLLLRGQPEPRRSQVVALQVVRTTGRDSSDGRTTQEQNVPAVCAWASVVAARSDAWPDTCIHARTCSSCFAGILLRSAGARAVFEQSVRPTGAGGRDMRYGHGGAL